jgi:glycosyltransferase involved in cell wall biosynthesis
VARSGSTLERADESAGGRENIRACFATSSFPPQFAGHGIQIRDNIPYLRDRGVRVEIVTEKLHGGLKGVAVQDPAPVHRVLAQGAGLPARLSRVVQFREFFRRNHHRYDLLHTTVLGWELFANIPYLRHLRLPVVVEMVSLGADDPLAVSRGRFGELKLRRLRQVDEWIGISRTFLATLVETGIPPERFHLIYGGVDIERFRPLEGDERRAVRRKLDLPEEGRVAIAAGAVIPRKRMDRVVRAWAHANPVRGHDVLLIIGPNSLADNLHPFDRAHVEEVHALARAPEVDGTVRLVGRVENLHEFMGAADLFVFLSAREGLGYVTIEALASGLPCVESPLDGIAAEILEEGETGMIVSEPDDALRVGSLISRLLSEPERRRVMGRAARRSAEERFSMEVRAEKLAALYGEIVERSAAPSEQEFRSAV